MFVVIVNFFLFSKYSPDVIPKFSVKLNLNLCITESSNNRTEIHFIHVFLLWVVVLKHDTKLELQNSNLILKVKKIKLKVLSIIRLGWYTNCI